MTLSDEMAGTAWLAQFTNYVDQSADRLRQTTDLYRQLTRRIAQGDVPPVVVESRLADFMSRNAESYANQMSSVAVEYLSKLVDVNADYARLLFGTRTPPEAQSDTVAPPTFDAADTVSWYERVAEYAVARSAETAGLTLDPVSRRDDPSKGAATNAGNVAVQRMAEVFLSLLSRVDEINAEFGSRHLEELLALGHPAEPAGTAAHAVAPLGHTATVKFAVHNTTASSATIRCVMTDVRRSDGVGPAFEPTATVTPSHFSLAAGQEEAVRVSIALEEPAFEPGPTYNGSLRILGIGDGVLDVPIEIRASLAAHESSAAELS